MDAHVLTDPCTSMPAVSWFWVGFWVGFYNPSTATLTVCCRQGDVVKIRTSIVLGTAIPLVMFLVWDAVILGSAATLLRDTGEQALAVESMSAGTAAGLASSNVYSMASFDPVASLRAADPAAAPLIDAFTLVAIATSYIGFVLALTDVFADALKVQNG